MGREIRRVRADWEHPKNECGHYVPMLYQSYEAARKIWVDEYSAWYSGKSSKRAECSDPNMDYWEWAGNPPNRDEHMPDWTDSERTHYQMYENTSEGTPISPVFSTPEEVARYCADHKVSSFADMTATYEQWLAVARGGWAPSAIVEGGILRSGVSVAKAPE